MARTIETLNESGLFDLVHVSTDDYEIADCAISAGASSPWRRPPDLSDDYAVTGAVISWELEQLNQRLGILPTHVCTVYPASVLITPTHLSDSLLQFDSDVYDAVISVLRHPSPIFRAYRIRTDNLAEMMWPEHRLTRSQELEETFYDAGQFYWSTVEYWRNELDPDRALKSRVGLFELSRRDAVDIDTEDDWQFAEDLYRLRHPPKS
jgi:N-acylneuraminate cytidylyltransferase